MPMLFAICYWLEHTSIGTAVRESTWLFPTIETLHIFGIILLFGSASILDLVFSVGPFGKILFQNLRGRICPGLGPVSRSRW